MNKLVLLLLITVTISSCINEDEQKGIDAVQAIVQAENVAVGSGTSIDTRKGEINYKTLTLKSGENLNNAEISDESISSISALTFYQNLSNSSLEKKNAIKVILERDLSGNKKTIESLYFKDTLELINRKLEDCKRIGDAYVNNNYKEVYDQLFNDVQKGFSFPNFEAEMQRLDEEFGRTKSYLIKGFKMKKATRKDGSKFPVVHFWVNLNRDSISNNLEIDYSLDSNTKGVLNLEL
jgi:hypothetical protein